MTGRVNLRTAFDAIDATWSPRVAARVDDFAVKLVRLRGKFVWHHHDDADELFMLLRGRLLLRFQDRDDLSLDEGELYVVPRGVEHMPVAEEECHVLLFERAGVVNTGSAGGERTAEARPLHE